MKTTKAKYSIANIKKKFLILQAQGIDVYFTATFYKGNQKSEGLIRQPFSNFKLLARTVRVDNPEIIRIRVYDGEHGQKVCWVNDYVVEYDPDQQEEEPTVVTPQSFQGYGEAEINSLVDQRLREQKRAEDFERLQREVQEFTEELEEQRERVELLEHENDMLKEELESKKQLRYYAGMLGDILEGIGIPREKLRNPLASLMGVTDLEPVQHSIGSDTSGIVEDVSAHTSPEEQKRNEIVSLMTEYLKTRDNQTLLNVFSIFSEIEQNPNIAFDILTFIDTHKTK